MKNTNDDFTIKTKKIDAKTVIIFGDSKNPDDFYFGKDFFNLKSFEPIAVEINTLMRLYGKPPIKNLENDDFSNINVYHLKKVKDRNAKERTVGFLTRDVPGVGNGSINIGVYDWPSSDIYWLPSPNLINNSWICSKTENCFYACKQRRDMDKHEKKCTDVQQIITQQLGYGSQNNEVSKLGATMNIDFSQYRQKHFCCFDIETFGEKCGPVSIAVASTLDTPKYFAKEDDSPEASYQMVSEFMEYLLELQQKLWDCLESEIKQAIEYLQAEQEQVFNQRKYKSKSEFYSIYKYFKNYEVLKLFGFNSR